MPNKDHQVFLTSKQIDDLLTDLAKKVENHYEQEDIYIIAPLKGSIIFCADLIRKIKNTCFIDFMWLEQKDSQFIIKKDLEINIKDKNVLIVKEIIDSGKIINFMQKRASIAQPKSVKVLSLLDRPARRDVKIQADFIGMSTDDRFMIGYGMDLDGVGRNYKNIYHFLN